ncbi:transglutaminase family protein [Halarcobacter anaerophilus]|uniref:Transglutaminase n=1 Tax=Halarcobacter anaerophilus TaxID=877500 RepID=A0A4Q0XVC8_9BACT|nr:transglutaminase family protein [Halarcobacter anaerophilus]QDF30381.1 transglutaminase family protein [Halarcobacter anaerophilus]RXJ61530.1 transglutaminase [Halarcobacter anaerophilus]
MIYEIFHETKFNYPSVVTFSHNIARLTPKDCHRQKLLEHKLEITPKPYESNEFMDYFKNKNTYMLIREPHKTLTVTSSSKVELLEDKIDFYIQKAKQTTITYKQMLDRLASHKNTDALAFQYLFETDSIPMPSKEIKKYILESFDENRTLFDATNEFMQRIFNDFKFVSGFTDVTTPIEEVFKEKKGVCQDFAQFAISALRSIGIPTRYMSGYIQTYPKEGEKKLFGSDASHAWFSIYIPDFGWVDFDPTNNKLPNEEYILLGYGRDYLDISPLKGVVKSSGESKLSVKVNVQRVEKI